MRDKKIEMLRLNEQGFSYTEIAAMFGTSRQNVQAVLTRVPKIKRPLPFFVIDDIKFCLNKYGYYVSHTNKGKNLIMHRYIYEKVYGKIPVGYVIHHKDCNKGNNDISNLIAVTAAEHTRIHGSVYNFSEETLAEMRELRKTTNVETIAELYGCSMSTAGLYAGTIIPEKGKRHNISKKRVYTEEDIQAMVEMHKTMGVKDISQHFKCRTDVVTNYLNQFEPKVIDTRTKAEKTKEYNTKYRAEHLEEITKQQAGYYKENAEEKKQYSKEHYQEHKEEALQYEKEQYALKRDEKIAQVKAYYELNKDAINARKKEARLQAKLATPPPNEV